MNLFSRTKNSLILSTGFFLKNSIHATLTTRTVSNLFDYSNGNGNDEDILYKTIKVELKGHDTAVMNSYEKFFKMAASELEVKINRTWTPPKYLERWTLLKSAHIYRKHLVQYESRTHYKVLELKHLTGSTADTFLEYIQRNLPEGMAMKVKLIISLFLFERFNKLIFIFKVTRKVLVPIPEFMLPSNENKPEKQARSVKEKS